MSGKFGGTQFDKDPGKLIFDVDIKGINTGQFSEANENREQESGYNPDSLGRLVTTYP